MFVCVFLFLMCVCLYVLFCNVWMCVCLGFVLYVCVFLISGSVNVWFSICGRVYIWVLKCLRVCNFGFCNKG